MRSLTGLILLTVGACAAQTTQMEACPPTGCGAIEANSGATASTPTATLTRQAAFDLKCDAAQLAWTAIGEESVVSDVRSWGVRGCGRQATYVLEARCHGFAGSDCNWLLNSPVQAAPDAAPAKSTTPPATGETRI